MNKIFGYGLVSVAMFLAGFTIYRMCETETISVPCVVESYHPTTIEQLQMGGYREEPDYGYVTIGAELFRVKGGKLNVFDIDSQPSDVRSCTVIVWKYNMEVYQVLTVGKLTTGKQNK